MKRVFGIRQQTCFLSVVATCCLSATLADAQTTRLGQMRTGPATAVTAGSDKQDEVKITRMPPPNKTAMVRTPEFNVNVQNTMPRSRAVHVNGRYLKSSTRRARSGQMNLRLAFMS